MEKKGSQGGLWSKKKETWKNGSQTTLFMITFMTIMIVVINMSYILWRNYWNLKNTRSRFRFSVAGRMLQVVKIYIYSMYTHRFMLIVDNWCLQPQWRKPIRVRRLWQNIKAIAVQANHPSRKYVDWYAKYTGIWQNPVVCMHQIAGIRRCSSTKYGETCVHICI